MVQRCVIVLYCVCDVGLGAGRRRIDKGSGSDSAGTKERRRHLTGREATACARAPTVAVIGSHLTCGLPPQRCHTWFGCDAASSVSVGFSQQDARELRMLGACLVPGYVPYIRHVCVVKAHTKQMDITACRKGLDSVQPCLQRPFVAEAYLSAPFSLAIQPLRSRSTTGRGVERGHALRFRFLLLLDRAHGIGGKGSPGAGIRSNQTAELNTRVSRAADPTGTRVEQHGLGHHGAPAWRLAQP